MGKKKQQNKVKNIVPGPNADAGKVFHSEQPKKGYNIYENDIASENPTNEIPAADMRD